MDQKWIQILLILGFYHNVASGVVTEVKVVKEGQPVDITCQATSGSMVIWYRVLDQSGVEFIASYSTNSGAMLKAPGDNYKDVFAHTKIRQHTLTLKAFSRDRDSGAYCCGSIKGNIMNFGGVTRLVGEVNRKAVTAAAAPATQPKQNVSTPCVCKDKSKKAGTTEPSMFCAPFILGPLAGGCGLLLLLLVIVTLYCNRIRTRRCPHHYKRKRTVAPEKQMMTGRPV